MSKARSPGFEIQNHPASPLLPNTGRDRLPLFDTFGCLSLVLGGGLRSFRSTGIDLTSCLESAIHSNICSSNSSSKLLRQLAGNLNAGIQS